MKIRFFGSSECLDCLEVFVLLEKFQIDYDYYDGQDIENEEVYNMCEEHDVEELPHLQFLDDNENIVTEHIGAMTEEELTTYLKDNFLNY
jgi:hypothetical protein